MRFSGKPFSGERIELDGNEYRNCKFTNCKIVYSGGEIPTLENNDFTSCVWLFEGAASRTLSFLTALHKGGGEQLVKDTVAAIMGQSSGNVIRH